MIKRQMWRSILVGVMLMSIAAAVGTSGLGHLLLAHADGGVEVAKIYPVFKNCGITVWNQVECTYPEARTFYYDPTHLHWYSDDDYPACDYIDGQHVMVCSSVMRTNS